MDISSFSPEAKDLYQKNVRFRAVIDSVFKPPKVMKTFSINPEPMMDQDEEVLSWLAKRLCPTIEG